MKFILVLSFLLRFSLPGYALEIIEPNASGSFYPSDPAELAKMVDGFLDAANPKPIEGEIFALILPHAGYGYSGQTAAFGYKLIKGKPYKTIIILGTSHSYSFNGASVYAKGSFATPLGNLIIDEEFAGKLLHQDKEISFIPKAFAKEHSVEVQLPFLQRSLSDFKIVPIVVGDATLSLCTKLAGLLKEAIGERKDCLVIVSTDMYHGFKYSELEKTDALTLGYLKNMDSEGLYYALRESKAQLCGGFAAVTALILSKELKHDKLFVLGKSDSAQITGNKSDGNWMVGYLSLAIDQEKSRQAQDREGELMLNQEQRSKLLKIARTSIETYLKTGKKMTVNETDPVLLKEQGAFVTLNEGEELRGCIGNLVGKEALSLTMRDMAIEAATGDPRFTPLTLPELKNIKIEISVLSPMQKVSSAEDIELGKHGVLVRRGANRGVFLPQVAEEAGWNKEEFLSQLCVQKAGIAHDAWKDKDTELYVFTAEIFFESKTE